MEDREGGGFRGYRFLKFIGENDHKFIKILNF